jgi:hypothetical protein
MRVEIETALKESLINKLCAILIKTMISGRNSEMITGSRPKSTGILRDGKKVESINALLLTTGNLLHNHTFAHPKVVIVHVLEVQYSSQSSISQRIRKTLTLLLKLNSIKPLTMLLSKPIQSMIISCVIQRLLVTWLLASKNNVSVKRKFLKSQSSVQKEESLAHALLANRYSMELSPLEKKLESHS